MDLERCPHCGATVKRENMRGHYERVHPRIPGSATRPATVARPTTFLRSHRRRNILVLSLTVLAVIGVSAVVAAMIDASTMKMHMHPILSATVNGTPYTVPENIGTPQGPWMDHSLDQYGMTGMSPLHTHDATGKIHVESNKLRDFTVGEFLAVWGKSVDSSQVLGHTVDPGHRAYLVVNGVEKQITETVVLSDDQQIKIVCGP